MSEPRLAFGTLTSTALLADSTNIVSSFPYASPGYSWFVAYDSLVTPYITRSRVVDNTDRMFGKLNFQWGFNILNDAQWYWLWVTKAANNPTPAVTVYARNRFYSATSASQWVAINCKMRFPELRAEGLTPVNDVWFTAPLFTFYDGVYASA